MASWDVLRALATLREGWGLVPLTVLVALFLLPTGIVPVDQHVGRWLRLAIVQAVVVGLCALFAVTFLVMFTNGPGIQCLCPRGCPHSVDGRFALSVPIIVVAVAQLGPWRAIVRTIFRQERGSLLVELGRGVFISGVPGVALAVLVATALSALVARVALPVTGALTTLLATFGVAIALRARSMRCSETAGSVPS